MVKKWKIEFAIIKKFSLMKIKLMIKYKKFKIDWIIIKLM